MSDIVVYHMGEMIQFYLPREAHLTFVRIKKESQRCGLDILRLAIQHWYYHPQAYQWAVLDKNFRCKRVDVRLSLAMRDEINELAWRSEQTRGHWLSTVLTHFLRITHTDKVIQVLASGLDVIHQMMETHHDGRRKDSSWLAQLRGEDEGTDQGTRHGRSKKVRRVDGSVHRRVNRSGIQDAEPAGEAL